MLKDNNMILETFEQLLIENVGSYISNLLN